jgi:serine/threonine-protein kinase
MARKFGKYRLHDCVNQGGITEIWLATDEYENVVAVRRLRRRVLKQSNAPKLFKAGLTVLRKLPPHPNVVRYINHGKAEGLPFMVLEFIQGANLKELLLRDHDHLVDNVADVIIQAADGINHLHDHGWMHLDIKPENLMISLNGHVSLLDFDTAQKIPRKPKQFSRAAGTPSCMPPEQLKNEKIDQRADIYAFGATIYELLTHRKPFSGRTPDEAIRIQLDENFPVKPVNHINPEVPIALSQLILRCLAHSPDQRYPNMTILNAQLHTILGVQQVPVTLNGMPPTIMPAAIPA